MDWRLSEIIYRSIVFMLQAAFWIFILAFFVWIFILIHLIVLCFHKVLFSYFIRDIKILNLKILNNNLISIKARTVVWTFKAEIIYRISILWINYRYIALFIISRILSLFQVRNKLSLITKKNQTSFLFLSGLLQPIIFLQSCKNLFYAFVYLIF
jgi:hypothetical protein